MSYRQGRTALTLVALLLVLPMVPLAEAISPKATVDVKPLSFTSRYVSNTDASDYNTLSRTTTLQRAANLWIVDGMVDTQLEMVVEIENLGTSSASGVNVEIVVLHDEYIDFELHNTSLTTSVSAGSTASVSTVWIPRYSGNHTVRITTNHALDNNPQNNEGFATTTIGAVYERCESNTVWSRTSNWQLDTTNPLNGASSCRIGGSASSNYGNMWTESLRSPLLDFSDVHPNPTRGFGLGFFYTGNVATGDTMQVSVSSGSNKADLIPNGGLSGLVDGQPSSWLIQLSTVNSVSVPWLYIPPTALGPQTQIEFKFISDASGTEVGYWVEDIVMFYDQKAAASEFGLDASGSPSGTSNRGEWSDMSFTVRNTGNLTDRFTLEALGLPAGWDYRFTHSTGSGVLPGSEIQINPGEIRTFKLQTKPPADAPTGSIQGTILVQSAEESSVQDSISFNAGVAPEYISEWVEVGSIPRCAPGSTCDYRVELLNTGDAGDTYALTVEDVSMPQGWTVTLDSSQDSSLVLPAGANGTVDLSISIPSTASPGETGVVSLKAQSGADTSSITVHQLTIEASMVSDLRIVPTWGNMPTHIPPGASHLLEWNIINQAERLDEVEFNWSIEGAQTWDVSLSGPDSASISGGESRVMRILLEAPSDGHAQDPSPIITPIVTSTLSGDITQGSPTSGPRIGQIHEISIDSVDDGYVVFQPGVPVPIDLVVTNLGNGVDEVILNVDGIPDGWQSSILVEGEPIDSTFELDLNGYEGDSANVTVLVVASSSMTPGMEVWLTFTADSSISSLTNPASVTRTGYVDVALSNIVSNWDDVDSSGIIGGNIASGFSIENTGNAVDDTLEIKVSLSPVSPDVSLTLLTLEGNLPVNTYQNVIIQPGSSKRIDAVVNIGDNIALGTEVSVTRYVRTATGVEEDSFTFTVDRFRVVGLTGISDSEFLLPTNGQAEFMFNLTSMSTESLEVDVLLGEVDGLEYDCSHQEENQRLRVFLLESPVATITIPITCEVTATPEFENGIVSLTIVADDGTELATALITIRQEQIESEEGLSSSLVVGSVGFVVVLLIVGAVVTVMVMRRRVEDDVDQIDSYDETLDVQNQPAIQHETTQPMMAGPPMQSYVESVTAQLVGPPAVATEVETFTPTVCGDCGYGFHPGSPWVSCITCGGARHPQCAMNTPSCWTCHSSSKEMTSQ